MRLMNEITVDAPADELFAFVSDIERVAACLPGARIDGSEGDEYRGSMRVKVGPITANYLGTLQIVELDTAARRAVLRARADEAAGQGQAEARIETAIDEVAGSSRIRMDTDLQIRGRVAQFGRGAMDKVAQRLFAEFARNVEAAVTSDGAAAPVTASAPVRRAANDGAPERRTTPAAPPRPPATAAELDVGALIWRSAARRVGPLVAAGLIGFGYGYLAGKLRERAR
jgi:carbon monoxide dehydrogenase subunit G